MSGAVDAAKFFLESVDPPDAMRSRGYQVYDIRRDAKAIGRGHSEKSLGQDRFCWKAIGI